MKIGITNYQSVESISFETKGFTAIVGKSNVGKSAILRALSASLFSQSGDFFIRRSKSFARVQVEFPDGLKFDWVKVADGKKSPGLETALGINGKLYTKLGRSGHYDLTKGYGFRVLEVGGFLVRPQVAGQFDKIFLLEFPDTVVAEVFNLISRGDVLVRAKTSLVSDKNKLSTTAKVYEDCVEDLDKRISALSWVEVLMKEVEEIAALQGRVLILESFLGRVSSLEKEVLPDSIKPILGLDPVLSSLVSFIERSSLVKSGIPDLNPLDLNASGLEEAAKLRSWVEVVVENRKLLKRCEEELGTTQSRVLKLEESLSEIKSKFCALCLRPF